MRTIGQGASSELWIYHLQNQIPMADMTKPLKQLQWLFLDGRRIREHKPENVDGISRCEVSWNLAEEGPLNNAWLCDNSVNENRQNAFMLKSSVKYVMDAKHVNTNRTEEVSKESMQGSVKQTAQDQHHKARVKANIPLQWKHKVQYTEYYGDGGSKGFNEVENICRLNCSSFEEGMCWACSCGHQNIKGQRGHGW